MIRTAILAGLLLVMLSIAFSRVDLQPTPVQNTALITEPPPVSPSLPSEAAKPAPRRVAAMPVRQQRVAAPEPIVEEEEAEEEEEAVVAEVADPPKAPEPPAQIQAAAPSPNAPVSLLTPPEPKVAEAPAPEKPPVMTKVEDMPLVNVAQRPAMLPWDAPQGTTHNSGATQTAGMPATPAVEAPKFMTPQERSRELYRLARDMEDLFITKLAR